MVHGVGQRARGQVPGELAGLLDVAHRVLVANAGEANNGRGVIEGVEKTVRRQVECALRIARRDPANRSWPDDGVEGVVRQAVAVDRLIPVHVVAGVIKGLVQHGHLQCEIPSEDTPSPEGGTRGAGLLTQNISSVTLKPAACTRHLRPAPTGTVAALPTVFAVHQLHTQNSQGQQQRDGVRHHNRPCAQQQAIHQPQRNARREDAVHPQRHPADIPGFKAQPGLRHKACSGQTGGDRAHQVDQGDVGHHRLPSLTAQSTSASNAGRAAGAFGWLMMATTTKRRPLSVCT